MRSDYHFSTHELRFSPFESEIHHNWSHSHSRLSTMRNMLGQFGREVLVVPSGEESSRLTSLDWDLGSGLLHI